jgi:hypothetical protein
MQSLQKQKSKQGVSTFGRLLWATPQLDCMIVSSCGGTMEEPSTSSQTQLLSLYSFPQLGDEGLMQHITDNFNILAYSYIEFPQLPNTKNFQLHCRS